MVYGQDRRRHGVPTAADDDACATETADDAHERAEASSWLSRMMTDARRALHCTPTRFVPIIGTVWALLYFHMINFCTYLCTRALLHLILALGLFLALLIVVAIAKIRLALQQIHRGQLYRKVEGTVTFIKKRKAKGFLAQEKVFVWLQYDSDVLTSTEDEPGLRGSDTEAQRRTAILKLFDEEEERPSDSDLLHAVQAHAQDNIAVGNRIHVALKDNILTQASYPPYLRQTMRHYMYGILKIFALACVSLGVLMVLYPGVPVVLASSSEVEEAILGSWFCRFLLGDDDDKVGDEDTSTTSKCCSIPWHVAWAYNVWVFFPEILGLCFATWRLRARRTNVYRPVVTRESDETVGSGDPSGEACL